MNNPQHPRPFGPAINRIADLMDHHERFAFKGVTRLAREAGVSPSSVSRLINGKMNPSFIMVARLTDALERAYGHPIDPRDLIAEDGKFTQRFCCTVVGCPGCMPENAVDEFGDLKPAFHEVRPGEWQSSRYPRGLRAQKKGES